MIGHLLRSAIGNGLLNCSFKLAEPKAPLKRRCSAVVVHSCERQQKETVGLNSGTAGKGRPNLGGVQEEPPKDSRPTLAQAGIDKKLSSKAQKLSQ
jgi:hypothetical protein